MKVRSFAVDPSRDQKKLFAFYDEIQEYNDLIIDIRGNGGGSIVYWTDNIVAPLANKNMEVEFVIALRRGKYAATRERLSFPKDDILPPEAKTDDFIITKYCECIDKSRERSFEGEIYLLVDRIVYSAAENFAVFAKASGFATLVGTTTGGDGIGFSPIQFVLPNSKLVLQMASGMGINPNGTANEETHTSPDIYVEEKWGEGDEILEYVLELIEE